MATSFKYPLLVLYLLLASVTLADNYNPAEWSTYAASLSSQPIPLKSNARNGVVYRFKPDQALGHWFRVSAATEANAPDFAIDIQELDVNSAPVQTKYFPTICDIVDGKKTCSNSIWLSPKAPLIKVILSWPKKDLVYPDNIKYEIAQVTTLSSQNEQRYKSFVETLKTNYYRNNEVDWDKAYAAGAEMLSAPLGIDPVPRAMWSIIDVLPGNSETKINSRLKVKPQSLPDSRIFPTCIQIDDSTWRLDLPGTATQIGNRYYQVNSKEYVERAQDCLSQALTARWIVNLIEQKSGDPLTPLIALAPVLGKGVYVQIKDAKGNVTSKENTGWGIVSDGNEYFRFKKPFPPFTGKLDFVVDKSCGESLCANIAAAVKKYGRLLGEASSTLLIENSEIDFSDQLRLFYTTRWVIDADGTNVTSIQPDGILDEKSIERVLTGELR